MKYRDKEWLQEQFQKYKTITNVARETGYPRTCITRYATRYGIYVKSFSREKCNSIKEDYFKDINTAEKSYFLGLIMADGNMYLRSDGKYQFSLQLKETDSDIIYKFAKAIEFNEDKVKAKNGVRNGTKTFGRSIKTYNQKFCLNLIHKGVIPNKSGKEYIPEVNGFEIDFIRGFIDGDGWIGNSRNRIGLASMSFKIIEQITNYFKLTLNISIPINTDKNLFRFDIYKKEKVFKILNHLYYKECISLERKNKLAIETMSRILELFGSL